MGRRYKRRGTHPSVALSSDQVHALEQWVKDFKSALPHIAEMNVAAKRIFEEMVNAERWRIVETEWPAAFVDPKPQVEQWKVGHAKVNYVDGIDVPGGVK